MISTRVSTIDAFRDPMHPGWSEFVSHSVTMVPTPMGMQPTAYIRNSRKDIPHGTVSELRTASVHDGQTLAVYLTWNGVSPPGGDFPDAVAVAFPVRGEPVLFMMGSKDAPLHILLWKANKGVKSMQATGIGFSDPGPVLKIGSMAEAEGNTWHVVVTRVLGKGVDIAPVVAGQETKVGFAVWYGANDERAGLKAISTDWVPFVLEA